MQQNKGNQQQQQMSHERVRAKSEKIQLTPHVQRLDNNKNKNDECRLAVLFFQRKKNALTEYAR